MINPITKYGKISFNFVLSSLDEIVWWAKNGITMTISVFLRSFVMVAIPTTSGSEYWTLYINDEPATWAVSWIELPINKPTDIISEINKNFANIGYKSIANRPKIVIFAIA